MRMISAALEPVSVFAVALLTMSCAAETPAPTAPTASSFQHEEQAHPGEDPETPVTPAPPTRKDEALFHVHPSDIALLVGTLSTIVGTTALANSHGEEGPGSFGIAMLGAGFVSYATGGVLAYRERTTSSPPIITVGPGLSAHGAFP